MTESQAAIAAIPDAARITMLEEALAAICDAWDSIDEPFQPQMPRLYKAARAALQGETD